MRRNFMAGGATVAYAADDGAAGGAGGAGDAGAGAGAGAAPPWYSTADETTRGWLQNNLQADVAADPVKAFAEAARQAREAAKFVGAPPDQVLRLPADQNPDAWKAVWQRLGAPAEPTGYDLSPLKGADGKDLDPGFVAAVQQAAAAANLPATGAVKMTEAFLKHQADAAALAAQAQTDALEASRTALKANWGQNYDANLATARTAFRNLGATPEQMQALEQTIGYEKTMELFRTIGSKMGEATFHEGGQGPVNEPKTVEAAKERIQALQNDSAWYQRWSNGGAAEQAELLTLMKQAYPADYAAAGAA